MVKAFHWSVLVPGVANRPPSNQSVVSMAYRVLETIERIREAQSPQGVLDVLAKNLQLQNTGCDLFMLNFLPQPGHRFEEMNLAHRMPQEWLDRFVERRLHRYDPALRHCQNTVSPFIWNDAPFDREQEPKYQELVDLTKDFGIEDGLMVPISNANGTIGNFWAGGCKVRNLEKFSPILSLIGHYAFHHLEQLRPGPKALKVRLTDREREVLKWAANGKTAWEIGAILALSKRTVEGHFTEACKKLGAVNKVQAVSLALSQGLIAI
jgi:LuxR family quorum sensing-dependent transcriptional regulator